MLAMLFLRRFSCICRWKASAEGCWKKKMQNAHMTASLRR